MTTPTTRAFGNDTNISWYRSPIDQQVLTELMQRNDLRGWAQTIAHLGLFFATGALAYFAFLNINAGQTPGLGNDGRPLFIEHGRTTTTNLWDGFTNSNYHALQVAVNRRMVNGLFVKMAYTYSRAIGMTDDDGWTSLNYNALSAIGRNRAPAGFNIPHIFRFAYVYELPFGSGKKFAGDGAMGKVLGGWQINGIFSSFQGRQFSLSASSTSLAMPGNSQ
ncbi:MAG: hypothetical protein O7H39_19725, partial [Gammaproteobacteria bacterium]|nr:hypothetical protein [Gammaproteobacteria bacterium]